MFAGDFKKGDMKRLFVGLLFAMLSIPLLAQSQEKLAGDSIPWELRKQTFIYTTAKLFNDPSVMKMSLYNLISENPSNPALYDSLALIYLDIKQFASAALVAQQSLQLNSNNLFASEIAANAFDNLGIKDRAIPHYESLYLANNDVNVLYRIAFLQMELGRHGEANTSVDIIMQNVDSDNYNIVFPKQDGDTQEVPLKVAAHRIKAMVAQSKGETEEATKLYLKTLEMHPGFEIVQQQLQAVRKSDN